jgi:CBS domain-containing protein
VEHVADALAERWRARRPSTSARLASVTEIMSRHVVCARLDLDVATLVDVMVRERLGCVPVVDDCGQPIGMVTKLDVVESLAAAADRKDLRVADVMMPLAITLTDSASVADAAALMALEEMHHVLIVSSRRLVGLVSTMDVTRWVIGNDRRT